jgi:hypothetical protein
MYEVVIRWYFFNFVTQQLKKCVYLLQVSPVYFFLPQHSQAPVYANSQAAFIYNRTGIIMRQISNQCDQKTYFTVWKSLIGNHLNYVVQDFLVKNLLRYH